MPERSDEFTDWNNQKLFDELSRRDSTLANNIGINNQKRLIRALQIVTKDKKLTDKKEPIYDALLVCCTNEREQLYELINQRVDAMFKSG
jgi:tRNA dimethylallyltransferase